MSINSSTNYISVFIIQILLLLTSCSTTEKSTASSDELAKLTASIAHTKIGLTRKKHTNSNKYIGIRSILISQSNELIYEKYFNDGGIRKSVNVASLGKSLLSAMVGIAIDNGRINSSESSVYQYFPYTEYQNWDDDKAKLKIKHLLTMTSGWQCGNIANYTSHCGAQMLRYDDSLKWLLDLPMQGTPGGVFNYNDAVPHLLVAILFQATQQHPAELFRQQIQEPLELDNNLYDKNQLTSRDMLKFGLLYLQKGQWNGKQLISKQWIEQSTTSTIEFQSSQFGDGYGYLWWQKRFVLGSEEYQSYYAAGNGGQYIFVIPRLDLVVVFTGNNYGNIRLTQQPLEIMKRIIVPTFALQVSPYLSQ